MHRRQQHQSQLAAPRRRVARFVQVCEQRRTRVDQRLVDGIGEIGLRLRRGQRSEREPRERSAQREGRGDHW